MSTNIDWSLDSNVLKKQLLKLSKPKLIKICKKQHVSSNGNKKALISNLLNHLQHQTNQKPKPLKKKKKSNTKKTKNISKPCYVPIYEQLKIEQQDTVIQPSHGIDDDDDNGEFRMDALKRELLVYGYIRNEFEDEHFDIIIFPSEIKKLLKLFVALFGWDVMKKGYNIIIDDLNDYRIKMVVTGKIHEVICFSDTLMSPYKYNFKLKIRGKCSEDDMIVGIVKTSHDFNDWNGIYSRWGYKLSLGSNIFALYSNGIITERKVLKQQTAQWKKNDILDIFVDMDELEMSFKLNDVDAKNIIDTVGNEYYLFVGMKRKPNSIELLNYKQI